MGCPARCARRRPASAFSCIGRGTKLLTTIAMASNAGSQPPPGGTLSEAAALRRWSQACIDDPYDQAARKTLAAILLRVHGEDQPVGTLERGRLLLALIRSSW